MEPGFADAPEASNVAVCDDRRHICVEPKAASRNTAQFITPGITPKFRMTRRPRGHSAPCIQQTLGRPLRHAQDRRNNIGHEEQPFIAPPAPVPDLDATLAVEGASRGEGDEPSPSVPVINIEIIRRKAHPLTGLDRRTGYQNEAVGQGSCLPDRFGFPRTQAVLAESQDRPRPTRCQAHCGSH